jgi:hypothetical protein
MSKKVTALIGGLVASLALVVVATQGCGSSSGSGDYKAICMQGCDKVISCTPDADAATITQLRTSCEASCNQQCSNQSARVTAGKACLAMSDCMAFETCGATTIPACQMTTGTGGSTGAGGSGTGGSGTGGSGTGGSGTGTGGTSGGGWTCEDQPGQGCTCLQDPSGSLTSCPSSYTCCFTSTISGVFNCSCTNPTAPATCAQVVSALGGTQTSHCPQ